MEKKEIQYQISGSRYLDGKGFKRFIKATYGKEHVNDYRSAFMTKASWKKHKKADYKKLNNEETYAVESKKVHSPWLYLRVILFLSIASIAGLACTYALQTPVFLTVALPLLVTVPLLVFLWELNRVKEVSLMKLGVFSFASAFVAIVICIPFILIDQSINQGSTSSAVFATVVFAPIYEELAKAICVLIIFAIVKPKRLLTCMAIGFSVGLGFTVIENALYATTVYGVYCREYGLGSFAPIDGSVLNLLFRCITDMFASHHFFAMIFATFASYSALRKYGVVSFGRSLKCWMTYLGLVIAIVCHMLFNFGASSTVIAIIACTLVVSGACYTILILYSIIGVRMNRIEFINRDYTRECELKALEDAKVASSEEGLEEGETTEGENVSLESEIKQEPMTCPVCGNVVEDDAVFCDHCGNKLEKGE